MKIPIPPIACSGCDLLLQKLETVSGKKLFCPRCNTLLSQKKSRSITKVLAITISGLLVYIPAIFLPLLTLDAMGMTQNGSVFDAFLSFYEQQFYFVALLLFLTSIFFPILRLSLLLSVSIQLKIGIYSRSLPYFFKFSNILDEWGMPDVYLIAIFVCIIKISNIATIEYNIGLVCFIFLVFMTRASVAALDTEIFWKAIEQMSPSADKKNESSN